MRFEEVRASEFQRMRKKTASLSGDARAQLDAVTREVLRGIAVQFAEPLASDDELAEVVAQLFLIADGAPADAARSPASCSLEPAGI
jgi:hypothetical protein